jgi:hypothetical protein
MRSIQPLLLGLAVLALAASAHAVPQFSPTTGTERLHTPGSGQPGAEWDTSGVGAGGQISYDSGTGVLSMTAGLNTLNYWDTANGSCATDVGSNCPVSFGPNLDITLSASLDSISATPVGGTILNVSVVFGTSAGVDLVVTDPADGDSVQLRADIAAGTFNGSPTNGITASVFYDTNTGQALSAQVSASGFFAVDQTTSFASLFAPDYFGLNISAISNFDDGNGGGLNEIVTYLIANSALPDFTAEGNGQIFKTASGAFVPEPGVGLLLMAGLAGLVGRARRF